MNRQNLIETMEVLSDSEAINDLHEAIKNINKGNFGKPLSKIIKELNINK